jgi:mRNA interferase RelE/StbE
VLISASAEKTLKSIPKKDVIKIITLAQSLSLNPYPVGYRKLSGEDSTYRVRQGNYRIIYEVDGRKLIILVLKIGHRKDIYR